MYGIAQFVEDEINFHTEHQEPLYFRLLCRLFNKRTPREVVLRELKSIKRFIKDKE